MGRPLAFALTAVALTGVLSNCTQTFNVVDFYTALDANGDRRRNEFYTDTREIHCVGEYGNGRSNVTVNVIAHQIQGYDYAANRFYDVDRYSKQAEYTPGAANEEQKLDFLMERVDEKGNPGTKEAFYEPGRYVCQFKVDGHVEKTAVFNIIFPPCPDGFITPATACFGFFPAGQVCPFYGALSSDPAKCTCDVLKGWVCQ